MFDKDDIKNVKIKPEKEKNMEKKKRFCTLSSAIMSVLGMVVFAIMCLTLKTDFRDGSMYLIFGLMVATILLNIGCFVKWSTTKIKYKKFLWYLIITLIVEFALAFFSLLLPFAVAMITIGYKLVWFTTGLIYLVVFALLLTDVVIGAKYKYDKEKKERKSRPFTLSASIVSTIVGAAVFGIMLYIIIALAQYGAVGYTPFIVWVNLISSLGVLGLGIPTIWLANSSAEKYKKAIGLFITAFVFSCLQVVLSLIYICVAGVNTIDGAISLIAMLGCAVSGTFYILDIARKNKAQQQTKVVTQQEVQQAETPKPAAEKSLVQSLQEIKEMKEMGLINDEDYEKLKSNILSNYKF